MITIDDEARRNIKIPTDIEYMSEKYKCINSNYIVASPSLDTIEKNIFYLSKNSKEIVFNQKYTMKPSYLSYDEYGTITLEYLLLYINNIQCIEDFNQEFLPVIVIPNYSSIIEICKDRYSNNNINDFEEINW